MAGPESSFARGDATAGATAGRDFGVTGVGVSRSPVRSTIGGGRSTGAGVGRGAGAAIGAGVGRARPGAGVARAATGAGAGRPAAGRTAIGAGLPAGTGSGGRRSMVAAPSSVSGAASGDG